MPKRTILLPQHLYDTELIATGGITGTIRYFATALGGVTGAIRKTRNETNLTTASQLPAGFNFLLKGIKAYVYATGGWLTEADFDAVYNSRAAVEIFVNQVSVLSLPLKFIPTGMGVTVGGDTADTTTPEVRKYHSNGIPSADNYYKFGKHESILMRQSEDFYATVNFPGTVTVTGVVYMTVLFMGTLKRLRATVRQMSKP